MNETVLIVFGVILFGGMMTMVICSAIAKSWLANNTGYQPSRAAAFLLGPVITSFGPMRLYGEARRARNEPTTLASVYWAGVAAWGLGILDFFGVLFSSMH
jgi:hypothetical protein